MDKRFYGVNVLDAINYDHFLYESAVKELKNGRIDSKAREGFKRRYVVYRAISIIYENYARVVFEYRREGRTLEESKQNLERLKSPKALTPFALKNKNLDKKALRESVLDYFHKAIMQTIDVYVVYGEEESRTFIRNELFPNILTDLFLNSCMKMSTK